MDDMAAVDDEVLVVVPDTAPSLLSEVRRLGRVTQLLAPRLVLVVAAPAAVAQIARLPGVAVHVDVPPGSDDLVEAERLFVRAWWSRRCERNGPARTRPGDGLSWDAEGFRPP